ncbi:hypothetical protein ACK8HX_00690 [Oryzobacter sp. R7]|uniref:hypothetical protein n=1 Tax=Oryzobacter faecalis TaxID=3388656 RepID=UPI00398C8BA5
MRAALATGLLVALPSVCFILLAECVRWVGGGPPPWLVRPLVPAASRAWARVRRRREPEPLPSVLLAMELRRLEAEVRRVEEGDAPHRAMRMRAALAAYDCLLLQLCERVGVETDVGLPPLPSGERLALEAELVAAGHDW